MFSLLLLQLFIGVPILIINADLELIRINSTLPYNREFASTIYDEATKTIYIPDNSYQILIGPNNILAFDISLENTTIVPQSLDRRFGAAVRSNNGSMYYIGGWVRHLNHGDVTDDILKLNPPHFNQTYVTKRLQTPAQQCSAVCDQGDGIYIIGGRTFKIHGGISIILDSIVKYNPSTNVIGIVGSLPTPRYSTSAVFDSRTKHIYIFGGVSADEGDLNQIVKYETASNRTVEVLTITQVNVHGKCTVWNGTHAFLLGRGSQAEAPILIFNPTTNAIKEVQVANFPNTAAGLVCSYVKEMNRIYILGGDINGVASNSIMYIDLSDYDDDDDDCTTYSSTPASTTTTTTTTCLSTSTDTTTSQAASAFAKVGIEAVVIQYVCVLSGIAITLLLNIVLIK